MLTGDWRTALRTFIATILLTSALLAQQGPVSVTPGSQSRLAWNMAATVETAQTYQYKVYIDNLREKQIESDAKRKN